MNSKKNELIKAKAIAKAWADPEFRARLKADPKTVLTEMGMEGLEGKNVVVVEDTPEKRHVVVPHGTSETEES